MGKSPGKWIKTVLFGKKGSRSNSSNGRHASKATSEKETWVAAKEPTTDFPVDPPSVSEPITGTTYVKEESLDVEEEKSDDSPCDEGGILPTNRDTDMNDTRASEVLDDPERIRQEQAAIKAQAAFRGYLARRAFWALKGIIRLQALVRGHLVRRQAITTLRCLQGIIKFQALVRNRKGSLEVHKKSKTPLDGTYIYAVKLSENAFVSKLLKSPTTAVPLYLHYIQEEPNSAWSWLERWTISGVCQLVPQLKKTNDSKSQSRQDQGRSKRTVRKISSGNVDNGMPPSVSEIEKPKRNLRRVVTHQTDPVQEQPQNELEKVKRSLRKVSNSLVDSTDSPNKRKAQASDTPDKIIGDSAEKMTQNNTVESKTSSPLDIPDIPNGDYNDMLTENFTVESKEVANEVVDEFHMDLPPLEIQPSEEEEIVKESQKSNQRRASLPPKEENVENGVQNSPTLPSYMQATQSAKAKLRGGGGQGSPKVVVPEKRRHSLPSSTNGKLNSVSPRPQKLVHSNEKVVQTGWRR